MKIFIPTRIIPTQKNINAVNIIMFSIIKELIKRKHKIILLPILYINRDKKDSSFTNDNIRKLKNMGVIILPLQKLKIVDEKRNIIKRIFFPKNSDFFPVINLKKNISLLINKISPDLILTIWDEVSTDLICEINYKKCCYYGDPPPLNYNEILKQKLNSKNYFEKLLAKMVFFFYKKNYLKFHLSNISKIEYLFNISKLHTNYYIKNKINCKYVNNIFQNTYSLEKIKNYKRKKNKVFKIIGNVGNLAGTANNLGIRYLLEKVLPELKKKKILFEVHLFGSGTLSEINQKLSKRFNEVKIRGFVKNLNYEICTSDVFLCCNNATSYNVGHTRFLHTFSLSTCLVGHKNISKVMPEIVNKKNCLLGDSPKQIAKILYSLSKDKIKLRRIGNNGLLTFKDKFSSKSAVDFMLNEIKKKN